MQRFCVAAVVITLASAALAASTCMSHGAQREPFTIVWNYDTSGYLETCGCSANQLGGIARRGEQLARLREAQPLLAIEGAHIIADEGEFHLYKGETVVDLLNIMGYDALQLGVREAQHGPAGIERLCALAEFPCFSANLQLSDGSADVRDTVVVEIAGIRVGITGVSDPAAVSFELPPGVEFGDPRAALGEVLPQLKRECDLAVLCLEGERSWIRNIARTHGEQVDLILAGNRNRATADWDFNPEPPSLNNWDQGRYLGVISVDPLPDGFQITGVSLPLRDELPESQAILDYLDQTYRPQLKERFFGAMKTDLEQLYMPPEACEPCHAEAYESYTASGHSRALKTLFDKHQLYNPDCMPCHVVYDPNLDELQPINCVVCHSNIGEQHLWDAMSGEATRPPEPVTQYTYDWCVVCHDAINSTPFAEHWPQYTAQIYHGGDMSAAEQSAERLGLDLAEPPPHH